ncbi:MAG: hypothetical protein QNK37_33865 [Acidobacteriota bacterium]|nr:hypothetical protein [Acidobacteriota bacterium]
MQYITGWERRAKKAGRREGMLEGKQDMFLRMVNRKFGVGPDWALTKVNEADVKQLDRWSDLLFTDKPLKEIMRPRT